MTAVANFVAETTSGTGASTLTLVNVNGRVGFSTAHGTGSGNKFYYGISNRAAAEWEYGIGYMSDATTLVRETVIGSSNAGSLVNFSAGIKDVVNDVPAEFQLGGATPKMHGDLNADSFNIVSVGAINVGFSAAITGVAAVINAHGLTGTTSSVSVGRWTNDANDGDFIFFKSRGGAISTHAVVLDNDEVGNCSFRASDGAAFFRCAEVKAYVDGTPSTGVIPGRFAVSTVPAGGSLTERLSVNSDGSVTVGTDHSQGMGSGTLNAASALYEGGLRMGAAVLADVTFSNVTSWDVDFEDLGAHNFAWVRVYVSNLTLTSANNTYMNPTMRFSYDSGSTFLSGSTSYVRGYYGMYYGMAIDTIDTRTDALGGTAGWCGGDLSDDTDVLSLYVDFPNPGDGEMKSWCGWGGGINNTNSGANYNRLTWYHFFGTCYTQGALDVVRFFDEAGANPGLSGRYTVIGYR